MAQNHRELDQSMMGMQMINTAGRIHLATVQQGLRSMLTWLLHALLVLSAVQAMAIDESNLLSPSEAFKPSLRRIDNQSMALRFEIAEGYYLYRHRFQFSLQPGDGAVEAKLPAGKIKQDEFFGEVETYRHQLDAVLSTAGPIPAGAKLKVVAQGCADAGICYPPQSYELAVDGSAGLKGKLAALFGESKVVSNETTTTSKTPLQPLAPEAKPRSAGKDSAADGLKIIELEPPAPAAVAPASVATQPDALPANPPALTMRAESAEDQATRALEMLSMPAMLLTFFGFGILLAFTACMYPLIPIVSGIVVGHGHKVSKQRGFALSFVYVQGMALSYAVAGLAAAKSGTLLSAAMQHPAVLGAFALLFMAMALSMFGLYNIQLPNSVQGQLNVWANRLPGGQFLPVFVMGGLSALIVGPCVGPALVGALAYIAKTGDMLLGGLALYSMALGMGLPLVVIGVFGGHVLPKAGPWMDHVKQGFGVLLLLVALWIVRPVLPAWLLMLVLGGLLIGIAVQLHALDPLPQGSSGWRKTSKALGVFLLLLGVGQISGMLAGGRDPLQPLKGLIAPAVAQQGKASFRKVATVVELDQALAQAKGRPVMLDFYADWCVSCLEMEKLTFSEPAVASKMAEFVLLKADVTTNSEADKALLARFKLFGPPGIIFFDRQGQQKAERLVGFEEAEPFLQRLNKAAS